MGGGWQWRWQILWSFWVGYCRPWSLLPPPTSFKPKSRNFPNLSTNPNLWAFVQQVTTAIEGMNPTSSSPSNLSPALTKALKSLQNHPELVIKPADKGSNVVVMDVPFYEHMCHDILNNHDWYRPISKSLIDHFTSEYNQLIFSAYQKGTIDCNTWNFLNVREPKTPTFYSLPKLHKSMTIHQAAPLFLGGNVLPNMPAHWWQVLSSPCHLFAFLYKRYHPSPPHTWWQISTQKHLAGCPRCREPVQYYFTQ